MAQKNIVTVFGSSRPRPEEREYVLAHRLGGELARAGYIVCNGGYAGIMEASACGAKESGGETIGIICTSFAGKRPNPWIDMVIQEKSLIARMMKLIDVAHAYVILKGGTGTLLELAAVWELMNKGIMAEKPILVLGDFWKGVVGTLKEELAWEGAEDCTKFVTVAQTAEECCRLLRTALRGSQA
ncbi:LOG family protein [bacterium]|nr:MAG: LOG family protein [bacterium]